MLRPSSSRFSSYFRLAGAAVFGLLVFWVLDVLDPSVAILATVSAVALIAILSVTYILAFPRLAIENGVLVCRRFPASVANVPLSEIVSIEAQSTGRTGNRRLVVRGRRRQEAVIDRSDFDDEEIDAVIAKLRLLRPDLIVPDLPPDQIDPPRAL